MIFLRDCDTVACLKHCGLQWFIQQLSTEYPFPSTLISSCMFAKLQAGWLPHFTMPTQVTAQMQLGHFLFTLQTLLIIISKAFQA